MAELTPLELEIGTLIVDTLNLEDVTATEIDREAPLFGEGLGLDSIDALELSIAISRQYGVQIRSDDSEITRIFSSLKSLSEYIERTQQSRAAVEDSQPDAL